MSVQDGWLARDGQVVAAVEVADDRKRRRRGLRGRDGVAGALVLVPCRHVHTVGMRFAVDVAFCAGDGTVLDVATLPPRRLSRPVLSARFVVEAEAGAFERWGVERGVHLEVLGADHAGEAGSRRRAG